MGKNRLSFTIIEAVLELKSAMVIGAGEKDLFIDKVFVVDAMGIPAIPGSSLAGVLRSKYSKPRDTDTDTDTDADSADELFGYQKNSKGQPSKIEISWGVAHDKTNKPVVFSFENIYQDDEIINFIKAGVKRDHVKINHKGTAVKRGKFDELLVPAGARFSFQITVYKNEEVDEIISHLHTIRLGGKTRSGHGEMELIECKKKHFDLKTPKDRELFYNYRLGNKSILDNALSENTVKNQSIELILEAEDYWLFGGGAPTEKDLDQNPVIEKRIKWIGQNAIIDDSTKEYLIPASSIKGALRHRALFHARRKTKEWVEDVSIDEKDALEEHDKKEEMVNEHNNRKKALQAIDTLFGYMKNKNKNKNKKEEDGQAGCLYFSDLYQQAEHQPLQHVSIDRFTQSAIEGFLFNEDVNYGNNVLSLNINIIPPQKGLDLRIAKEAFVMALQDLAEGRLALGAGANRGHGYFKSIKKFDYDQILEKF